jgi:hypothetical protein
MPLLIAAAVTAALAVGFFFGVMFGLARRPYLVSLTVPWQEPASACRYPGPPVEPAQLAAHSGRVR